MASLELDPALMREVGMLVAPYVDRLADRAKDAGAEAAPRVKVWKTAFDERVRPWHKSAHEQAVPDNLRFALDQSPRTYLQHQPPRAVVWGKRYSHLTEYLREPRDPSAHWTQRDWCRCFMEHNNSLAKSITKGPTVVTETEVKCEVYTRFPRAGESEFGTIEDAPALFMSRAAHTARL